MSSEIQPLVETVKADPTVPVRTSDMGTARAAQDGETFLVTLGGDLDMSNAAKLEHVLVEAASSDATLTVVDLTHLRFIDSTGVQLLMLADRAARASGRPAETRCSTSATDDTAKAADRRMRRRSLSPAHKPAAGGRPSVDP